MPTSESRPIFRIAYRCGMDILAETPQEYSSAVEAVETAKALCESSTDGDDVAVYEMLGAFSKDPKTGKAKAVEA